MYEQVIDINRIEIILYMYEYGDFLNVNTSILALWVWFAIFAALEFVESVQGSVSGTCSNIHETSIFFKFDDKTKLSFKGRVATQG